ncbi:hypothetical protein [uncultured Lacinutrix sp.]|uniref:hypothetical protein n=1 Tax=uncultured Lacinutrix sp. TaxID=574032 RepID=UPI002608F823|nr:hypothetical protein [uncultured Lacinutrix sp.]
MDKVFNFDLNDKPLSKSLKRVGIKNFLEASNYIKQLPYGRNTDRANYTLVLKEQKGTCSTKHAFLKQIAIENNITELRLILGIYKMNNSNTKGVGSVLDKHNLDYIPEAHTYLKVNNTVIDLTNNTVSNDSFENSILLEEDIIPDQIGDYKTSKHKAYLEQWIVKENINFSFKDVWHIREKCIEALSNKKA